MAAGGEVTQTGLAPIARPPHRVVRVIHALGLAAWAIACVGVGAYLLAAHLLTLPTPPPSDRALHQAIATNRKPAQADHWLVLHVLYEDCKCSRLVLDHVLATPRPAGADERIVLVADDGQGDPARVAAIRAAGFDLDVVAPDALVARYHIEAAPLLVIVDPGGEVRYLGGYTPRKQAADVRDVAVITATLRGETVTPLPAFGCAVGRAMNRSVDPFGIRRWK